MAATWVSTIGPGMMPASCQQISMSWRAAWKTLMHLLVGHQVEEGSEIDALGNRVDHHRLVRPRHLSDAEHRVVGALAQELGVDRDEGVLRQPGAGFGQSAWSW